MSESGPNCETLIELPSIDEDWLLTGGDVPEALWVLDEKRGNRGEPYAIESLWVGLSWDQRTELKTKKPASTWIPSGLTTSKGQRMTCSCGKRFGKLTSAAQFQNLRCYVSRRQESLRNDGKLSQDGWWDGRFRTSQTTAHGRKTTVYIEGKTTETCWINKIQPSMTT